ncbi:hypothetical protein QNN00_18370 [Bacillus velezensis]|nr:hypothetical protein [Bacillus velezensis]
MKHCFFHLDFPAFMFLKRHNKQPVPADRTAFLLYLPKTLITTAHKYV